MPASMATSSRRRPVVRRRGPSASPTSPGRMARRRRRRKSASSARCIPSIVPAAVLANQGAALPPGVATLHFDAVSMPRPPVWWHLLTWILIALACGYALLIGVRLWMLSHENGVAERLVSAPDTVDLAAFARFLDVA